MGKKASPTLSRPGFFPVAVLLLAAALAYVSAHESDDERYPHGSGPGDSGDAAKFPRPGGYWMPGGGYGIPGWTGGGNPGGEGWRHAGGGWGAGYGGPGGGYARGGVVRPAVVCRERGPCHGRTLACPARCFSYHSHSGKNYGGGGGGGGCTIDCKKKCAAYC